MQTSIGGHSAMHRCSYLLLPPATASPLPTTLGRTHHIEPVRLASLYLLISATSAIQATMPALQMPATSQGRAAARTSKRTAKPAAFSGRKATVQQQQHLGGRCAAVATAVAPSAQQAKQAKSAKPVPGSERDLNARCAGQRAGGQRWKLRHALSLHVVLVHDGPLSSWADPRTLQQPAAHAITACTPALTICWTTAWPASQKWIHVTRQSLVQSQGTTMLPCTMHPPM